MAKRKPPKLTYYGAKAVRGDDDFIVGGFDVETENLGGKLLSIQWGVFGTVNYDCSEHMLDNFVGEMMQYPKPVIWFGHFAQYDWRYMLDELVSMGYELEISMRTETDIYQITIVRDDGQKVVMRDSYALWPHPLAKLASSFCPEIPKLDIDFEKVTFDPENPAHIEYAKRDVLILITGLPRLNTMLQKHFGVNANATTASTALKAWQKTLKDGEIYNASKWGDRELFTRQAYYGGLVFLTSTKLQHDCETYDRNSSYPASMVAHGVPVGRQLETRDYEDGRMGIYRVRVKAPDDLIVPIIPARDKRGTMRWYRGEFDTVVTNRELIFAANHGYKILQVYEGIVWEDVAFPFNEFIGLCKQIRFGFRDKPEEFLAKLMQNALYGKFGSRRERLRIFSARSMTDEDLIGSVPYDDRGLWYVKKELDEEMRCAPEWAVFITAHSRLSLLQQVYSAGPENVFYGDTDSITLRKGYGSQIDVGLEYGQWKLEKEWREFRAIAPKVYAGVLADGRFKGAAKGLPRKNLTDKHWRDLLTDGTTEAQALSLPSLRVALKKGVTQANILTRKSSTLAHSLNFQELPNGAVRPKIAA